jgi:TolB-like protein
MTSIIEGYSYDIFISYRQNDNKYDGWVTEFVNNLNKELEANIKDKVSVYFDINPQDGLLETHSVDRSLEDKLKCLIFIPIISRTYCDSKSFAWQHELVAFNEMAKVDQFGRDIRVAGGNVTSRILPVKIHDLDPDDKTLLENELGGVLRCIEFIYKSAGVNRPLRANEDHPQDNLNKTYYRDQINKVANAIKEIIGALKKQSQHPEEISKKDFEAEPSRKKTLKTNIIAGTFILMVVIVSGYFIIPKLFRPSEQVEKSVAVLPFSDFSASHDQEYFANGMMEEILNQLANIKDLEVISRTSSMIYKDSKLSLKNIAHELGVSNIVEGSVQKADGRVRITVQLIDGITEKHIWSESYDRELSDIFSIQTEISMNIARELKAILTSQEESQIQKIPTKDAVAYDYYLRAFQYSSEIKQDSALRMLDKAIEHDPEFVLAYLFRASYYSNIFFTKDEYNKFENWQDFDHLARADLEKAMKINPDLPDVKLVQARLLYNLDRNNDRALELLNELLSKSPNKSGCIYLKSLVLRRKGLWEEHLKEVQKYFLLDPFNGEYFVEAGYSYRLLRRYPEAMDLFNRPQVLGIQLDPDTKIRYDKFLTILLWKGNVEEALKISELNNTELGVYYYPGDNYFYYSRKFDKLVQVAEKTETQFNYSPKTLNLARAYFLNSNILMSRNYADSAIDELNMKIREFPDDDRFYAALGYAYAYKGENKKAIESAQKAVKLKPMKMDVWQGFEKENDLANVYILAGEYDKAMDKIEYLLTIPGELSVPLLKIDPAYDRLRDLPRFKKILTTEYNTKYQ